jgi:hypothetical protein
MLSGVFVLLVIIILFICNHSTKRILIHMFIKSAKDNNVISGKILDSLLFINNYALLIIGINDCDLCQKPIMIQIPDSYHVAKYYIDIKFHKNNLIFSQALYTRGFPTSYIIDKNYNILGIINGSTNYLNKIDSILIHNKKLCPLQIDGDVKGTNVITVLSYSFKAIMAYFNNDYNKVYALSLRSKTYGSFFFNNYMLYSYFKNKGHSDSILFYRKQILKYNNHVNRYIFKSLIDSMIIHNEKKIKF